MLSSRVIRKLACVLLLLTPAVCAAESPPDKLLAVGRIDDAISALQNRIAISPQDAESQNLLCRAYFWLADWDASVAACQKAVALDPGNSQYHLWLGRAYGERAENSNFFIAAGLARKVGNEFETAVRLDPNNVEARADLADFYVQAPSFMGGGVDKAVLQAQQLYPLDPAQSHIVRAQIAEKQHDPATAENEYRAAVQANGGKPGSWLNLGQFYRRSNHLDQMEDAIQHAASAPENQHILIVAAETLMQASRNLPGAEAMLRRYVSGETVEDAPLFKAHYVLGTLLEQQGNLQAAAQEYRNALALARNYGLAQNALRRIEHGTQK